MNNNIYKKLLSFLTLIALTSSFLTTQALTLVQPNPNLQLNQTNLQQIQNFKAVKPAYNPQIILNKKVWSFLINTKPLLNKEVLELTPVTASNAWKILKTWNVTNNFKKNFVVKPKWSNFNALVLKLDQRGLNEVLSKTNQMKTTYSKYKNIGIWKLEVYTPKLERLPDRLVLTSKSIIKFKTKKEFDNIKKYYKLNKKTIYQALSNKVNLHNKNFLAPKVNFKLEDFYKDFYYHCKKISSCKNTLASKLWISTLALYARSYKSSDAEIIEQLILSDKSESQIVNEEKIEISLLPVDPLSKNNFNYNLRTDPKLVRISAFKIQNTFNNLKAISWINQKIIDAIKQEAALKDQLDKICKSYTWAQKTACEKLASEYIKPEPKNYEKILINGITIWNEYSYRFHRYWSKTFLWRKVTIYEVDVKLEFGYGFGIRIPIKAKININKPVIRADATDKKYKATIEVKTVDATAQQYREAWIDNSQIFDWKEFVFTVYAYVKWKLVLVNHTVFNKTYDLIKLLWELLWISWLHSFDESKNFTPPFAWTNLITLLNKEFWIPIYSKSFWIWGWTIYWDILFQVFIDWYIKAYCKTLNSIWSSCNRDLEFRSLAPKVLELEAIKNVNDKKNNVLWEYNEYWIILKDFRYIPQLVAAIKSRARLHWWYDIKFRDDDGDISTPRYEIYRFTIDLPELWAHVWYWINWRYELTEEQKQISATANKYYQKLKIILNNPLSGHKIPDWVIWNHWIDWNIWNWINWNIWNWVDWHIWGKIPRIPWKVNTWSWEDNNSWNNNQEDIQENPWDNWSWYTPVPWEEDNSWNASDRWDTSWEDNSWDDYYPWVEWRPTESEDVPDNIEDIDKTRWWLLNWKWVYPEDLELRVVPKTAISLVQNFFKKRTPAKRAKLYSQILTMIENYENNPVLKVKKARLINILKDLRDIMVVYRLR